MWPTPYTGLKAVHDQKINEALEHFRFSAKPATQKHGLRQTFDALLAHFTNSSVREPEAMPSACDEEVKERLGS